MTLPSFCCLGALKLWSKREPRLKPPTTTPRPLFMYAFKGRWEWWQPSWSTLEPTYLQLTKTGTRPASSDHVFKLLMDAGALGLWLQPTRTKRLRSALLARLQRSRLPKLSIFHWREGSSWIWTSTEMQCSASSDTPLCGANKDFTN